MLDRTTSSRTKRKAEKSVVSRLDLAKFQPGMIIPVRVDPKDPSRVAVDVYH
jgi:hypothetical protein